MSLVCRTPKEVNFNVPSGTSKKKRCISAKRSGFGRRVRNKYATKSLRPKSGQRRQQSVKLYSAPQMLKSEYEINNGDKGNRSIVERGSKRTTESRYKVKLKPRITSVLAKDISSTKKNEPISDKVSYQYYFLCLSNNLGT